MTPAQRGVAAGMAGGLLITLALTAWCLAGSPGLVLAVHGFNLKQRLIIASAAAMGPAFCLAVAIGQVAALRFFSPADIDGAGLSAESAAVRVPRAVLANTLEQTALAVPVYLALALGLPGSQLAFPLMLSAVFVVGRVLFVLGYARGAAARSLGFTLTFYPSVAGLIVAAVRLARIFPG